MNLQQERFDITVGETIWGIEWKQEHNGTGSYISCESIVQQIRATRNMGFTGEDVLQIIERQLS